MRLYVRSADRRPDPAPPDMDVRPVIRWITLGWALALVVALVARDRLEESGRGWWVWTPAVAIALGLYGLRWLRRRR